MTGPEPICLQGICYHGSLAQRMHRISGQPSVQQNKSNIVKVSQTDKLQRWMADTGKSQRNSCLESGPLFVHLLFSTNDNKRFVTI